MPVTFNYDGAKLTITAEVDFELTSEIMTAVKRIVVAPPERDDFDDLDRLPRRKPGGTRFIMRYLAEKPDSIWADVKLAMQMAGYRPHQGMLVSLVDQGRVIRIVRDHGTHIYRLAIGESDNAATDEL
jgi:hypothetical protein